jgi:hypothetical protein
MATNNPAKIFFSRESFNTVKMNPRGEANPKPINEAARRKRSENSASEKSPFACADARHRGSKVKSRT